MIQILFAVLAGVLTIAAPCILPLLPILLGTSIGKTNKMRPIFIVAGFILTFSLAAFFLSLAAKNLNVNPGAVRTIGAIVLGAFGVLMLWPTPFELLMLRFNAVFTRLKLAGNPEYQGRLSGFILGMTLGIVWTPCAGPVLGSILTLIALQKDLPAAGILIVAYAMGAAIPMLVIAYGGQYISNRVAAISDHSRIFQIVFGVIIILLAFSIYFNYDIKIYSLLLQSFPSINPKF